MTYKNSIELFKTRYRIELAKSKFRFPELNYKEIMMLLSEIQTRLANRYKLAETIGQLNLVEGQSTYSIGTGVSHLPKNMLMLKSVEKSRGQEGTSTSSTGGFGTNFGLNFGGGDGEITITATSLSSDGSEPLRRVSREDMFRTDKQSGFPCEYTIYGTDDQRVFEINSFPDKSYGDDNSYQLSYIYIKRIEPFDDTAGTTDSISFPNYDEGAIGFGGEWDIPLQWQPLLVEGALAEIFEKRIPAFEAKIQELVQSTPKSITTSNKYHLGVTVNQNPRRANSERN